jgi:hypothetical protein
MSVIWRAAALAGLPAVGAGVTYGSLAYGALIPSAVLVPLAGGALIGAGLMARCIGTVGFDPSQNGFGPKRDVSAANLC